MYRAVAYDVKKPDGLLPRGQKHVAGKHQFDPVVRLAGQTGIHERSRTGCKGYPCTKLTVVFGAPEKEAFRSSSSSASTVMSREFISYDRLRVKTTRGVSYKSLKILWHSLAMDVKQSNILLVKADLYTTHCEEAKGRWQCRDKQVTKAYMYVDGNVLVEARCQADHTLQLHLMCMEQLSLFD